LTRPAIIAVAITGSVPRKKDNPAVPVTPSEQIESTHEAYEVGASLVHIHVRNPDETPSSKPELFAQVQDGVRKHCPGMIIQFSTGGRGRSARERASALQLKPDMASLATGSVNFPNMVYENSPELVNELARTMREHGIKPEIEVFDLAMLYNAKMLLERGLLTSPVHVQFVMGIPNALPARRQTLEFLVSELGEMLPHSSWTAAGIGRCQSQLNQWSLELGGHLRTGLEDNIRLSRDRLAASNAELVTLAADLCGEHDAHPATPAQARKILNLPATES
jgi:3-keto-5-aminohexanoate cleavage enzyme